MSTPFPPALGRLLLAVLALFALLVGLGLHGWSLPWWHRVIDGSAAPEVLLGEPRAIRSDDWKVNLPMAFAQRAHEPAFPLVNRNVGLGQNMLAPVAAPVAHPLILLRPTLWGFFLGNDTGMAWLWWSQVLGAFASFTLLFALLAHGRLVLAAGGALLVVTAPFFQLWSLVGTAQASYAALTFVSLHGVARAEGRGAIAGWGGLLAWSAACLGLAVYPPYQVAMAWLLLVLVLGTALAERETLPWRRAPGFRAAVLAAAGLFAVGALAWLLWETREVTARMQLTEYPGRRFSTGGDRTLPELVTSTLGLPLVVTRWERLLNVCEAAGFLYTFPVVGAALVRGWLAGVRRRTGGAAGVDPVAALLLLLCVAVTAYAVVGVPDWIARPLLLGFVPGKRAVIALGLADVALLVRFLAREPADAREPLGFALPVALTWGLLLVGAGLSLQTLLPEVSTPWVVAFAVAHAIAALVILRARRRALALAPLLALSLVTAGWFNPLVRGGSDYLVSNPLSQRILAADREAGGGTRWAAFGPDELADLFRVLGLDAVNGLQPVPQFELWRPLDPTPAERRVINRYAHVGMQAAGAPRPLFRLVGLDTFFVELRPTPETLRALGVTHVLVRTEDPALFERLARLEPLGSVGVHHLYRVPAAE